MATSIIKMNNEVDQTANNSISISCPNTAANGSYDLIRCFANFPFYTKNLNYSISNLSVYVVGIGALNASVEFKTHNGISISASYPGANGSYLVQALSFDVIFA